MVQLLLLPLLLVLPVSARSRLWICSCALRWPDWLKVFPQLGQAKGRSPVWICWWRRSSAFVKPLGQWAHTYGFWPVWMSCSVRSSAMWMDSRPLWCRSERCRWLDMRFGSGYSVFSRPSSVV
uniref:Secreted protein n=1 Tax=Myripristis murdjan TaxID=586833 RepID=A0A667WBB9_9TELE